MGITLIEALTIPPFNKSKVIAGSNGLNRIINSVSSMDVPDLFNWIQGNELILTSGYFVKQLSIYDLVKKVNAKGASGIAIKLNRYVKTIDDEVVRLADGLQFPILSLPFEHPWVDFITPLVSAIVSKKTAEIEHSKKIFDCFTNIVLKGGDFKKIIISLSKILNKSCALFDKNGNFICDNCNIVYNWLEIKHKNSDGFKVVNNIIWHKVIEQGGQKYNLLKSKVKSGQEYYGDIFVIFEYDCLELSEWDIIAIQQVITVLCLEFQKKKAIETVEKNYKESFLNDILLGQIVDSDLIESKSSFFGLKLKKGGTVIIVDFKSKLSNINSKLAFQTEIKKITEHCISDTNAIITFIADQLVIFIPTGCNIDKKVNLISKCFQGKLTNTEYKIGIGRNFPNSNEIAQSYIDAKNVIKLGECYDHIVLDYRQLGILRLILGNIDKRNITDYFYEYLGPVLLYEKENNIDLLLTLSTYYQENCNIRNTAKKMFIHFNTVKYRLNLIEDILKLDINDPEIKNTLGIAIKLKNIVYAKK